MCQWGRQLENKGVSSDWFISWQRVNTSWEQSTPFYQYDTQNGHFKGRHERKMSAPAPSSSDHRGRRFIKIRGSDRGWTMKKMTQMADKDRPCTPLCFLLPTPTLFSIFRAGPGWRKWRKAATGRGRRDEKGNETGGGEGATRTRKLRLPGEEQKGF